MAADSVRLSALGDLPHDMRVAKMRPGHTDRIRLLGRDGVPSRRDFGDPRRMEDRKIRGFTDFAGKVEMRRRRHTGDRDNVC